MSQSLYFTVAAVVALVVFLVGCWYAVCHDHDDELVPLLDIVLALALALAAGLTWPAAVVIGGAAAAVYGLRALRFRRNRAKVEVWGSP